MKFPLLHCLTNVLPQRRTAPPSLRFDPERPLEGHGDHIALNGFSPVHGCPTQPGTSVKTMSRELPSTAAHFDHFGPKMRAASFLKPNRFVDNVVCRMEKIIFTHCKCAIVALAVVLMNPLSASAQNLFANPGFEMPATNQSGSRFLPEIASGLVWRTTHPLTGLLTGLDRPVELWANGFQTVTSAEGIQHAETSATLQAMVYQSLALTPGQYDWSFCHRGRRSLNGVRDIAEFRIGIPPNLPVGSVAADAYDYPIVRVGTTNAGAFNALNPAANVTITPLANGWVRYSGTYNYAPVTGTPVAPATVNIGFWSISGEGGSAFGNFIDDVRLEKKFCCPGQNLVVNGNFELPPSGTPAAIPGINLPVGGFNYTYKDEIVAGATHPGEYNVVTSAGASTIAGPWVVNDPAGCIGSPGSRFMVVNGRTSASGSTPIWSQLNIPVTPGKEYQFCAKVKNLPQCWWDMKPTVRVGFTVPGSGALPTAAWMTATVNEPSSACAWRLISGSITVPNDPLNTSLTITIRLDDLFYYDGNDLALDDISLQEKPQVSAANVAVALSTSAPVGQQYQVTATYPPGLPGFPYGYLWQVCELDANNDCVTSNSVANPPQWWTYTGPVPPGQVNQFWGYNGLNGLPVFPSGSAPGTFSVGKRYRIVFGVWSDCESLRVATWELQFTRAMQRPQVTPLPVREHDLQAARRLMPALGMGNPSTPTPKTDDAQATIKTQDSPGTEDAKRKNESERLRKEQQEKRSTQVRPEQQDGSFAASLLGDRNVPRGEEAPGNREAAELSRAEDDASVEIATARPSVEAGQRAPDFKVELADGRTWHLSDQRNKRNVLLTFFPRCFTGGCANHLSSLRDRQIDFDASETEILAISVDPAAGESGQLAFAKQWQLNFPMVPDTQRQLSKLYGAVQNDRQLAARMSVLIDKQGIVRLVDTNVNVTTHGADMIGKIRELGMGR